MAASLHGTTMYQHQHWSMHLSYPQWMKGLFVSQVQMLMVLSWQVAEVMMELWEPYAKQNIVTLYTEQLYNASWFKIMLMSSTVGEGRDFCMFKISTTNNRKYFYKQMYCRFLNFSTYISASQTVNCFGFFKYENVLLEALRRFYNGNLSLCEHHVTLKKQVNYYIWVKLH